MRPTETSTGAATFAGVFSADAEIFLCKDAQGSRGGPSPRHVGDDDTGGVWMSWWMGAASEVDELHDLALRHGFDAVGAAGATSRGACANLTSVIRTGTRSAFRPVSATMPSRSDRDVA